MKPEAYIVTELRSLHRSEDHLVIAVCGAADLGKSYLSDKIARSLNSAGLPAGHLSLDSYLMSREKRIKYGISGYQPDAYDFHMIETQLIQFKNGFPITYFPYNHATGRQEKQSKTIESCDLLIIDGLHSMHGILKPYLAFSIFIYTWDTYLRKIRREADKIKRKQDARFSKKLEGLEFERYKEHVEPYRQEANILLFLENRWNYAIEKKNRNGS